MKQEHLTFLDKLRKSGKTNMFGARPYLQRKFSLENKESDDILTYWLENFDSNGTKLKEDNL